MAYFNLKCCSEMVSKIIILVLNILVIVFAAAHFGYAGQLNITKNATFALYTTSLTAVSQTQALATPPVVYYVIGGIIQVIVSALVILVLFDFVGKQNRLLWFRILLISVFLEFAINFAMAIYACMIAPYYRVLFDSSINLPSSNYSLLSQIGKDLIDGQVNLYNYTVSEAIYTWIVVIPSITVIIISLVNEFVNEKTVDGSSKISPQNRLTTQVESFGNNSNASIQNIQAFKK